MPQRLGHITPGNGNWDKIFEKESQKFTREDEHPTKRMKTNKTSDPLEMISSQTTLNWGRNFEEVLKISTNIFKYISNSPALEVEVEI